MEPPSDLGLFEINTTSQKPPTPDEVGITLWRFRRMDPPPKLTVIPGDFSLVKYSLIGDNKQLVSVRDRFFKFINDAKASYGVICIDCNPSSSFLTLCALQVCTHILVPIRPDRYSIIGLEILSEFVAGVPTISPKPEFIVALNAIPRSNVGADIRAIETELRGHPDFGPKTLSNVIRESGHLRAKTDYTGFAADKRGPWTDVLRRELGEFANEPATKIGL